MKTNDIMSLKLEKQFSGMAVSVTKVVFIWDYYELWLGQSYVRFLSKTYIEKDHKKYRLGTMKGNYIFSHLLGAHLQKYREFDNRVEIDMDNRTKIICDTTIEQSCFNFHMKMPGTAIPIEI